MAKQNRQTISYLTKRFAEVGLEPNRRHGQNFLIDLNLIKMLADSAKITPDDVVLEIGTGTGSLTGMLAENAAHVITVEIDAHLYQIAREELEEVENLKACPDCPTCVEPQPEETPEETPEPEESSSKTVTVYRMKGSTWNWEGRSNPSTEFMRQHLKEEHGIDASLMDRKAMQAIHDNCHNYGDDKAFGFPTEYNSSMTSNCPSGTCPLPGSSGSGSCPTCPGGSSSRSYSRGLFGRWR